MPMLTDRRRLLHIFAAASLLPAAAVRADERDDPLPDVGRKFTPDGRVIRFAGNTVICHLDQQGARAGCFNALLDIYREAPMHAFLRKVTLLPPSSYHMTVFGGANDSDRQPPAWPRDMPLDLPLDECHRILADRLREFKLGVVLPIRMRVDMAEPAEDERPLTLRLLPLDAAENNRLRDLRDRLAVATGIRALGHDAYRFHITLGYQFARLTHAEHTAFRTQLRRWRTEVSSRCPVIELGPPEYCTFEDMFAFERSFFLQS